MFEEYGIGFDRFCVVNARMEPVDAQKWAREADCFFLMGGGACAGQMQLMRDKGIYDIVRNGPAMVLGVSAGSMNMGKTTVDIWESPVPYEGLGFADITIIGHFSYDDTERLRLMKAVFMERPVCAMADEGDVPSCGVLSRNFYIGAEGMVAPCMGMTDCGYAEHFPNLNRTPLKDILRDSEFVNLCYAKVGDVRARNPKCRECAWVDRCTGGCRNEVLTHGDDYYGVDPNCCLFFENGWDKKIRAAAEKPFAEYLLRHPTEKTEGQEKTEEPDSPFC